MNREQKAERVAELKERLGRSGLTVLTDFTGLAVEDMTHPAGQVEGGGRRILRLQEHPGSGWP